MTPRIPLTIVILTLNEEENLPHALRSVVDWVQEVVVLDSGSTDATRQVAERFGARFEFHRFEDYSKQRTYALRGLQIDTDWVLFLDADEWVPEDLRSEISTVLSNEPAENGFFVTWRFIWMGKPIRFGYRPSWFLRLVRREAASCDDRGVNEHLTVSGAAAYLSARLVHEDRKDISDWIKKHDRYATREALCRRTERSGADGESARLLGTRAERTGWIRTRVWSRLPPLVRPWLYFLFRYVVLGGFLDGRAGFTFHFLQALWYQTLIDIKFLNPPEAGKPEAATPEAEKPEAVTPEAVNKAAVRSFWDQASCGEALYLHGQDKADYDLQAATRYSLEPYIPAFAGFARCGGQDVLEIGVGLGADHQRLVEGGARMFGLDLTARAIAQVRTRFDAFGLHTALQIGDAERLAFGKDSFDMVYSWGVLHHTPDTPASIREVWRVLRTGGEARVMIYHKHSLVAYMLWLRYGLGRLRPFTHLSDICARYLESPGTKVYTVAEGHTLFSMFREVEITTHLTHGDLLSSAAGQRHNGVMLRAARRLWPRQLIQRFLPGHGLFMLIRAVK